MDAAVQAENERPTLSDASAQVSEASQVLAVTSHSMLPPSLSLSLSLPSSLPLYLSFSLSFSFSFSLSLSLFLSLSL